MTNFRTTYKFFLFIFLIFCSCDSDDDCQNTEILITNLEEAYACTDVTYIYPSVGNELPDLYTIVSNEEEYSQSVTANCTSVIDFSVYDLVIGDKGFTGGYESVEFELIENCESQDQVLTITIAQNIDAVATVLTYNVLIPKLDSDQDLIVNFVFN